MRPCSETAKSTRSERPPPSNTRWALRSRRTRTHNQKQIARARPSLAYAPTRMLIGFRFRSWRTTPAAVYERFTNRAAWEITFVAAPLRGTCSAGKTKTFQLDGNKVYWSQTRNEQQAWRCVRNRSGLWVRLVAASPQPPTKLADTGLGRVVASAKRI